jgi:chromosome partitioning protein
MDTEPDGKAATEIKDIITELMAMKAIQEDGIDRSEKKFNTIE